MFISQECILNDDIVLFWSYHYNKNVIMLHIKISSEFFCSQPLRSGAIRDIFSWARIYGWLVLGCYGVEQLEVRYECLTRIDQILDCYFYSFVILMARPISLIQSTYKKRIQKSLRECQERYNYGIKVMTGGEKKGWLDYHRLEFH